MKETNDKLLEVSIAALRLGISPRQVYRLLKNKNHPLRGSKITKGSVRVYESSIFQTIKAGEFEKTCDRSVIC